MLRRRTMGKRRKKLFTKRFFPAGTYTWTVPAGCTEVDVFLVGGGGGSGDWTHMWGIHGAGGGGYTKTFRADGYVKPSSGTWMGTYNEGRDGDAVKVTPGQSIQIIVGAGGNNADGGYSQFMNANYRADGGKKATSYRVGGNGGSAGGTWWENDKNTLVSNGASDGANNVRGLSLGQGHTTRDFGEPTGRINAGGGAAPAKAIVPVAGASDYAEGSGSFCYRVVNEWVTPKMGGGGYGGGSSCGDINAACPLKGGDGTVLIRYWAYEE